MFLLDVGERTKLEGERSWKPEVAYLLEEEYWAGPKPPQVIIKKIIIVFYSRLLLSYSLFSLLFYTETPKYGYMVCDSGSEEMWPDRDGKYYVPSLTRPNVK